MFAYTVSCAFAAGSESVAERWLDWLRTRHLDDVLACGAVSAEVVQREGEGEGESDSFDIHYRFADRAAYEHYVEHHAPRLRQEGLALFPLELGLSYTRKAGPVRLRVVRSASQTNPLR